MSAVTWWLSVALKIAILAGVAGYGISNGVRTDLVLLSFAFCLLGLAVYIPLRFTDQISLAYAGYLGIGAYSVAVTSDHVPGFLGVLLGILISAVIGLVVALATRQLSGYFLAVATMLVAIALIRFFLTARSVTGGPTGVSFEPQLWSTPLSRETVVVGAAAVILVIMVLIDNFARSRMGSGLLLMSEHQPAAEALGLHASRLKVIALVLGAGVAAVAGSILALGRGFVLADSFALGVSFIALFVPIIGGMGSPWGCLIGALTIVHVQDAAGDFGPARLLFGLGVLLTLLAFRGGIVGAVRAVSLAVGARILSRSGRAADRPPDDLETRMRPVVPDVPAQAATPPDVAHRTRSRPPDVSDRAPGPVLSVQDVRKSFGGIVALRGVTLEVFAGETLGIIGPNGAGKSTLVDIITGHQAPSSGAVSFGSRSIESWSPARRALAGMARTFQHPKLWAEGTVAQNIELGLLRVESRRTLGGTVAQLLRSGTFPRRSATRPGVTEAVVVACRRLGIAEPTTSVSDVAYGVEKLTEVARAIVSLPVLLLLDEPFAGLNHSDIQRVTIALEQLKAEGVAVILVDHNVDVMRDVTDRLLVLAQGRSIREGDPVSVLEDPIVREAYFGETAHV